MRQCFRLPNGAVGTAAYNPLNKWIDTNASRSNEKRSNIKIDNRPSDKSSLAGRLSHGWSNSEGVNCFGNIADPCTQGPNFGHQYSAALNYNHTFSPTLVLNVMLGYARSFSYTGGVAQEFKDFSPVTTLGVPQYILTSGYLATPNITLSNGYQAVSSHALGSHTFSILQDPLATWALSANLV